MTQQRFNEALGATTDRHFFRDQLLQRMQQKSLIAIEVAQKANISKHAMTSYTSMRSLPSHKTLKKLAQVLECKPEDLVGTGNVQSNTSFVEVREFSRPNYKLFVARLPLPSTMAVEMLAKLVKYLEDNPVPTQPQGESAIVAQPTTAKRNGHRKR